MTVRALSKVAESYSDKMKRNSCHTFKLHGAVIYDSRILTVKSPSKASILTLDGHILVTMSVCKYHSAIISSALRVRGQADLGYTGGKFYLFFVAELPDKPQIIIEGFLGVDLGIAKIASTSDGMFYSGVKVKNLRKRRFKLRRKLQSKGTKSAKRLLKRYHRKEARFAADVYHCISKKLVEVAAVIYVDPHNTSRTCSKCGHVDKRSRKDQAYFVCTACGHALNADINAALNIARCGAEVIQPNAVKSA